MSEQKKVKSPFKKDGMFNEANLLVFELAKELRRNMTDAEIVLWGYLKAGINGLKFRKQHPLGIYIADFYCHKLKLNPLNLPKGRLAAIYRYSSPSSNIHHKQ